MAAKRPNPLTDRIARAIQAQDAWKAAQGAADAIGMIPDAVGRVAQGVQDYAYSRTPEQFGQDVYGLAYRAADDNMRGFTQNPVRHMANQAYSLSPLAAIPPAIRAYNQVVKAQQTGTRPAWRDAMGEVGLAAFGALPGAGGKGSKVLKEGEALLRDAEGIAQIGHNMAPTTKKALATESRYLPPSQVPIVTQAGKRREPLGGHEQFNAQHPSAFTPFHNINPSVDPAEVTATYRPMVEMAPPRMLTPADLEGGDVISLYGDRTRAGEYLTGINGREFAQPVELHGGPDYGRMHQAEGSPAVWASEASPISALKNRIRPAIEAGRDVYGVYTPMGPTSLDQSTMMTDTLARMIQAGDIKGADIKAFDQMANAKGWNLPSVGNTDELIDVLGQRDQGTRKQFVKAMDQSPWLDAGFPDVGAARMALTTPDLMQMPAGASGYRVAKFGPETLQSIDDPYRIHGSYDTPMAGQNMGQLDELVPFDLMFPDFAQARRAAGASGGSDLRSLEMSKPYQTMTPEAVDRLMLFRSGAQKRRR